MFYLIDPIEADKMARIDCTCYSGCNGVQREHYKN